MVVEIRIFTKSGTEIHRFDSWDFAQRWLKDKGITKYEVVRAENVPYSENLKLRYGLTEGEIRKIVEKAKSQPEALRLVRAKAKNWDWRLERLVTNIWNMRKWGNTPLSGAVKKELEKSRELAVRTKIQENVEFKTVPKPEPKPVVKPPVKPLIAPQQPVIAPQPKVVSTTAIKPKTDNKKLIMAGIGILIAYMLLKR